MIYLLFGIGCLFTYGCYKAKRRLEHEEQTATTRYFWLSNAFEVLVPFTCVTLFYVLLTLSLSDMGGDETTLQSLRGYEKRVQTVHDMLSYVRLSPLAAFLLVGGWFLIALVLLRRRGLQSAAQWEASYFKYKQYNRWLRRLTTTVGLLGAFTFFGGAVDSTGTELQAHIKTIKDNYNEYANQVGQAVTETVATELHNRMVAALPAQYHAAQQRSQKTTEQYEQTAKEYRETKARYEYTAPQFETLQQSRQQQSERAKEVLKEVEPPIFVTYPEAPFAKENELHLSSARLRQLSRMLTRYSERLAAQADPLLRNPVGAKVTPGALGILFSYKNFSLLQSLAQQSPLLDVWLPVLTKTLAQGVDQRIQATARRLAEKEVVNAGAGLEPGIQAAATQIAQDLPLAWPSDTAARLEKNLAQEEQTVNRAVAEVNTNYGARRQQLEQENDGLLQRVKNAWQEKLSRFSATSSPDSEPRPDPKRKGEKDIEAGAEPVFQEFVKRAKTSSDPLAKKTLLEKTLAELNRTTDLAGSKFVLSGRFPRPPYSSTFPGEVPGSRLPRDMRLPEGETFRSPERPFRPEPRPVTRPVIPRR